MAPLKRKGESVLPLNRGNAHKKPKPSNASQATSKASGAAHIHETETDSDPLVESDTTSRSGDSDGASWPSDENTEEPGVPLGDNEEENDEPARVKPTLDDSGTKRPAANAKSTENGNPNNSSRESHAKQKVLAQERKAAKSNADSIARSKKLWEKLRRKSHVPLKERKELVAELFGIITGRVKEFVFKHDSVRVVQTALKYANLDQRKMIARELKGDYRSLAESKYAKFLVGKILVHGDEEIRDMVVPDFYGHVRRMIKHPEASWILDDVYRGIATPSQKAILLSEWYGAEFALFKSHEKAPPSAELKEILASTPEKRTPIMRSLHDLINLLIQKKTNGFTMLHDAMLQYFLNVQPASEEATEFIELLKGDEEGDLLKNLAFTKSGSNLVCLALAYGNAKDRKHILRTYKGLFQAMASDPHALRVLLTVYDVVDDTVLTAKSIFPELVGKDPITESQQQELLASVTHLNARIPLLYLFSGQSKAILSSDDMKLLDSIHQIRTTASKKDPEARRKELITSLSPPLLSFIATNAQALIETSFGCQFITEVLLEATGDRSEAMDVIANLATGDDAVQDLLKTPAAGRMLKTLVVGGRFNPSTKSVATVEPPLGFHDTFYQKISKDVVEWAVGANSFVVVGLLEAPGFSRAEELKAKLEKERARLVEAAGSSTPGNATKPKGKAGKAKAKIEEDTDSVSRGNAGSRKILEKLALL